MVYTSSDPTYTPPPARRRSSGERKLFGPRFDLTVAPGRVIEGVIRDRDSGRPVSGVDGTPCDHSAWTTSDVEGRFRSPGSPSERTTSSRSQPRDNPTSRSTNRSAIRPGWGRSTVDVVTLKRGVWVEGQVTNRADGRPVKAIVQYYPLARQSSSQGMSRRIVP